MQNQLDLLERFFHYTVFVPYDNWDWDGRELTVWLNDELVERYSYSDIQDFIKGFR